MNVASPAFRLFSFINSARRTVLHAGKAIFATGLKRGFAMLQLNILHGANRSADAAGNTSVAHAEPQSGLMDLGKITAVFMVNLLTTIPNGADCFCFHRNGNRLRPAVAGAGDGFHARVQLVIDHRIGKGEYDGAIGKRNAPLSQQVLHL